MSADTPPVTHPTCHDRYDDVVDGFAPQDRTLRTMLQRQADRYGDRPFVTCGGVSWTFARTAEVARDWGTRLGAAGISAGDRVLIHCSNRAEFLQAYLGATWIGAIATPVNTAFRGAQLAHVLANAGPKLLIVEEQFQHAYDDLGADAQLSPLLWPVTAEGIQTSGSTAQAADILAVQPGDTAAILYTSGTTGPSKGVCCPQAQFFWWGIYSARALGVREGDVLMTALPVFHTNALNAFYQALLMGCEYVLLPKFSASGYWTSAVECRATVTYLLGAMAAILMAQPERPGDRKHVIRTALGGGVPARDQETFFHRFGVPLVDGYASTESNFLFYNPYPSPRPGSMGKLAKGAHAMVADEHDMPVPDGTAGELLLRPTEPHSFASGYFGMPEKTVEAWANLWFHTGDRVVRNPDGYFSFIDRMKDAIRRRGENVSSWEVEQAIMTHDAIEACAVYPVPSELGEDEVATAIQLKDGQTLPPLDLIQYLETRLAHFAVPRYVRQMQAMPLTENGKIKKVVLREEGIVPDMWDLETTGYKVKR
ncbi:ATP-dependent acyl-CoA ligase [Sulfitobacter sp. G21635-S1]|uniref:ATP-dependent acyl-CoA ligase n=1 Tax=Sulfitobacter sp. G21635-S1 TaxID=3014043 RepID=UPI0022AFE9F9|nr:ATP-dependent acyl-CoA ligase [Sulfitobacter sp. G21635-S1]MCZ4257054.1 ATP-dependent acyl-CoA ligase [Sulfitobacter sp. G21635-S1]